MVSTYTYKVRFSVKAISISTLRILVTRLNTTSLTRGPHSLLRPRRLGLLADLVQGKHWPGCLESLAEVVGGAARKSSLRLEWAGLEGSGGVEVGP